MAYAHSTDRADQADWQPLREHLLAVGETAAQKGNRFGATELARVTGQLHDLGKYSAEFQRRLEGAPHRVDHSTAGAQVAMARFGAPGYLLAYAVAGHHAGLPNGRDDGERSSLATRLAAEIPDLDPLWRSEINLPDSLSEPQGFTVRRDRQGFQVGFLVRMLFSCLVDADFRDTEAFYARLAGSEVARPEPPALQDLRSALDRHLSGFTADSAVNRERAHILRAVRTKAGYRPGLFSLTVPTGGGKTLASLAFALDHAIAHGMERVIYVIPFTSIVEQTAAVFRDALGEHGEVAVLEHHSAFDDGGRPETSTRDKLHRAKEDWDAPVVVTTAVQFFESLFAARTSRCRKLHNIARSVVILDEAQTLPLRLLRPCVAAMDELALNYRAAVVVCTATQPALEERADSERSFSGGLRDVRELAPEPRRLQDVFRRVSIRPLGTLEDNELATELLAAEQVLCIVNNRRHARALFEAIRHEPGAYHLTTAMCAVHRRQRLAVVRRQLAGGGHCRLVATSLIEAGVDVDFPRVLRAEAGLDSIIQAAGRCNREGKRPPEESELRVFATANRDWTPPKALEQFAQAAREVLRQHGDDPSSLEAIEHYFRHLYWQQGDRALDREDLLGRFERGGLDGMPFEFAEQRFRMIEDGQSTVIIPFDTHARQALRDLEHSEHVGGIARRLQPYTVQVPRKGFEQLRAVGAIAPVRPDRLGEQFMLLVNRDLYDDSLGLNWTEPTFRSSESNVW